MKSRNQEQLNTSTPSFTCFHVSEDIVADRLLRVAFGSIVDKNTEQHKFWFNKKIYVLQLQVDDLQF